jgi:hypothetical protein
MAALLAPLMLATPTQAAQERLPLDGIGVDACTWNTCTVANLDDDPDAAGGDWATSLGNNDNHNGHFTFPSPAQTLTTGAGLQEFRISLRQDANCGTGTPEARIELWEAGVIVRAGTAFSVTAANSSQQVASFTWDATEITAAADVEIKVFGLKTGGAPNSRCTVDLGAVEWNADTTAVTADTLTVSQTNVPSADVQQGISNKLLQVLDLSVDANSATLTDLTVTRLGTAVDADTTTGGVRLWHDVNNDNAWDGGDALLSTAKTFSGGTVTFDAIGFTTTTGTPEKLLVTVDIAAAGTSTEGNTIGSSINASGDVVVTAPDTVTIATPLSGNTHAITDSGDTLTVNQTSTGGGNLTKGTTDNVVMVLDLTADNEDISLTDLSSSGTTSTTTTPWTGVMSS